MGLSGIECPLPEVAKSLAPYIHTREETLEIRRTINSAFSNQDGKLNSIALLDSNIKIGENALSGCTGVRKAYQNALDAHKSSQARIAKVRNEIWALQETSLHNGSARHERNLDEKVVEDAIDAIRHEQRRQKLQIVERAFQAITTKVQLRGDLEQKLNELQLTHSEPVSVLSSQQPSISVVDGQILELKKAVIRAQRDVDASQPQLATEALPNGLPAGVRTEALRRTRDELISLIEAELAKLPEDTTGFDGVDGPASHAQAHQSTGTTHDLNDVQRLYDNYVDTRASLVTTMNDHFTEAASLTNASAVKTSTHTAPSAQQTSLAAQILPFTSELQSCSENEQAMMEQNSYMRRQVAYSSSNIQQARLRLADESLLVAPGATSAMSWVEAAKEARAGDHEHIETRLQSGEQSLRDVQARMERILALAYGTDEAAD